jgi:hypothetical protein
MEVLTKSDLAVRLGVTRGRISQLCSQGMPVLADGRVDFDAACQWISQHVDRAHSGWTGTRKPLAADSATPAGNGQVTQKQTIPRPANAAPPRSSEISAQWRQPEMAPPPASGPAVGNDPARVLLLAKAKKALADLRRVERLEQLAAGEVIPRAEVDEYATTLSALVRDATLAQADRLADRLAGKLDRAEVYGILRADGRALLERLSRAIRDAYPQRRTTGQ